MLPQKDDFSDYDSDDSIADKTYKPEEPRVLQVPLNSDSEEEQEIHITPTEDFATWEKVPIVPQKYIDFIFSENMGPKVQVNRQLCSK